MPTSMSRKKVLDKAKELHNVWICYYGTRNARRLSYYVRQLFRKDIELEKKKKKGKKNVK